MGMVGIQARNNPGISPSLVIIPLGMGVGFPIPGQANDGYPQLAPLRVHPQSVSAPQIEEEFAQRELGCLGDAGPGKNEVVKGTSSLS